MTDQHTHHHHHHQHQHDCTKANAEFFSERAQSYRNELSLQLAKRCATAILKNYHFDSNKTEILDFACGPGLIAFELLPHAKRIIGADLAEGMVNVFNQSVKEQGISSDKMHCIKIDSLKNDKSDFNGLMFDAIICIQAYHHLDDPIQVTRTLVQHLKPNGRLFVIDFLSGEDIDKFFDRPHAREHEHIVAHKHGFSREQMIDMFKAADLQNPQVEAIFNMPKSEIKKYEGYEVFGRIMDDDNVDFTLNYFLAYGDKA